jgi:3-oxoacyl-[acyl-carrier-protein] synthase-3
MSTPLPHAAIAAISTYLPAKVVKTSDLESEFGAGSITRIAAKTGIAERRVASEDEFTSDLATAAGEALFGQYGIDRESVDFLLVCTQSPDHPMPSTSCLVHHQLGLRADAGALDLGMGCSGYVYGLGMATGLIESGQAQSVLLITADTLTKYLNPADRQLRTIFGDGAAATLVTGSASAPALAGFSYGTDGAGAAHLVVPNGGLASGSRLTEAAGVETRGLVSTGYDMYMNGSEVFTFSLRSVPSIVERALERTGLSMDDIDLFVFHQANEFMLETLRKKLRIPSDRFVVEMSKCGNTTSSSIPLALAAARDSGRAQSGMRILLVGFGVGLSWGAVVATL